MAKPPQRRLRDLFAALILSLILLLPIAILCEFWSSAPALMGALILFVFVLHHLALWPEVVRAGFFVFLLLLISLFAAFEDHLFSFMTLWLFPPTTVTPEYMFSLSRALFRVVWPTFPVILLAAGMAIGHFFVRVHLRHFLFAFLSNRNFEWMGRFYSQATTHLDDFIKIELIQWASYSAIVAAALSLLNVADAGMLTLLVGACVLMPTFGVWLIPVLLTWAGFILHFSLLQGVGLVIAFALILFLRYGLFYEMAQAVERRMSNMAILSYVVLGFLLLGPTGVFILPPIGSLLYLWSRDFIEIRTAFRGLP